MNEIIIGGTHLFFSNVGNLIGFVMPVIVELVNNRVSNTNWKFIITLVMCLIVAVLLNWSNIVAGSVEDLLGTLTLIFTESQVVFKLYFEKSKVRAAMNQ
jgi:hypothetical protein